MTSFTERAKQLKRQGAKPWRAAPAGAIAGYDRGGSTLLRAVRHLLLIVGGVVLLAVLTAYWAGYDVIEPKEARILARIRSRALTPDDIDVVTQVPHAAIRAVADLLRVHDPSSETYSSHAIQPVWTPDTRRLERLSQLTAWLSARDGQKVYNLLDRLNRIGEAATDPAILSAYEQVLELSTAERESFFGEQGNFSRLTTMVDQLIVETEGARSLSRRVEEEKKALKVKDKEFRLEIERMTSDYNTIVSSMKGRRSRLNVFKQCYDNSLLISR